MLLRNRLSLEQEIRGENEEETGSYECRAENEAGFDSRFYQVTVLGRSNRNSQIPSTPRTSVVQTFLCFL